MIMKLHFNIFRQIAVLAVFAVLFSCSDDFFDVSVGERITPDQHFQSLQDANASMNGTLVYLQDVAPKLIILDGLRTDQMLPTDNADPFLKDLSDLNFAAGNPYLNYADLYKVIINVNETLAHIKSASDRDRDFKPEEWFDMRANLYGLRAWCYLNLVRIYGEATWIDGSLTTIPDDLNIGTVLRKDAILDTLINQFQRDSIVYDQNLMSPARNQSNFQRFPNYKAVLGELYLEKNDYDNAIYYLKLGLETAPVEVGNFAFKVDGSYAEVGWESIFKNGEIARAENMLVVPYSINNQQFNPLLDLLLPNQMYMVKPSQLLIDSMQMQISTKGDTADVFRGMGLTYDTTATGQYFIKKYSMDESQPYSTDIVLQRAADIHLLLAEALNRAGQSDVALMFLNSGIGAEKVTSRPPGYAAFANNRGVRGRVLLTPRLVPDSVIGMDRIEMIEDLIIQEKALECAFEGKRMSDLMRVAARRDNPGAYLAEKITAKFSDPAKSAEVSAKLLNPVYWYIPIK